MTRQLNGKNGQSNIFDDDKPIKQPGKDYFGFRSFAKNLANAIIKNKSPEGTVIAIHGPWGSGKSSMINLVKHYLDEKKEMETDVHLQISDFKCWWLKGEEQLTLEFFRHLSGALKKPKSKCQLKCFSKLKESLWKHCRASSPTHTKLPLSNHIKSSRKPETELEDSCGRSLSKLASRMLRNSACWTPSNPIISFVKDIISLISLSIEQETIEESYNKISKRLSGSRKHFLIVIDDIDRLACDEVLLIFHLIKSVGRLPKITYLLAYDREIVQKIVSERYRSEGPRYLEKIVQASFDIPYPLRSDFENFFLEHIRELTLWRRCQISEYAYNRFPTIFNKVIMPHIQSPRDIIRVINVLKFTWPAVEGEVDLVDFLALETIRMKQPNLYVNLKHNKNMLIDANMSTAHDDNNRKSLYEDIFLSKFKHEKRTEMKQALSYLFPSLDTVWRGEAYGKERTENEWERQRRVCSPKHFDTYFRFSLSQEIVSKTKVDEVIKNSGSIDYIIREFLKISRIKSRNKTYASALLHELKIHADSVPVENTIPLISGLLSVQTMIDIESDDSINFIYGIYIFLKDFLLDRTSKPKRSETISQYLKSGNLGCMVIFVFEEYPKPEKECLVTKSSIEELCRVVLRKIQAIKDDSLLKERTLLLSLILRTWQMLDSIKAKSWCMKKLSDDFAIERFAEIFLSEVESWDSNSRIRIKSHQIPINILEKLLDPKLFKERVEDLLKKTSQSEENERYVKLKRFSDAFNNNAFTPT